MNERVLLTIKQVCDRTSLSRSQVYNMLRDEGNRFPKSFALAGTRRVVFDSLEIQAWIDQQAEQARAGNPVKQEN